mgnify:CR=1 FL=1
MSIKLNGINCFYGAHQALFDITLNCPEGETLVLLGPSGAGKSSLLRVLNLLEMPRSGTLAIAGNHFDFAKTPSDKAIRELRQNVGMVFQQYNLWPHLTVLQNLIEAPCRVLGLSKDQAIARAEKLLERLRLKPYSDRYPLHLSGGQQQRVAIARSLVNEPEILLLDEPLGALDLKLRKEMQLELKRLQREMNITFIYVTHDQEEALTMSDTVVVMNGGKVQQIGTPEDIYNEPKNAFVADFIGDSNIVDGVMHRDFLVSFSGVEFPCVDRGFAREESVQVVVRPEDIEVVSPVEGQLVGVVNDVIFKGVHFEMHVECEGREWLIHSTRACTPGETIGMRIGPNEIHIMSRSEG